MKLTLRVPAIFLIFTAYALSPLPACAGAPPDGFSLGPGRIYLGYGGARIPLAGDADGDGRADFLGVYTPDGSVDCMRTSALGKPLPNVQARTGMGKNVVAAACGAFASEKGDAVVTVAEDGTVKAAFDLDASTRKYRQDCVALSLPRALAPRAPALTAVGDFEGRHQPDVLIAGADGRMLLLASRRSGAPAFAAIPVPRLPGGVRRLAAGVFKTAGAAELVWLDKAGVVRRAALRIAGTAAKLANAAVVTRASAGDGLCVGHFLGLPEADILVGQRLLPGGNAHRALPVAGLPGADRAKSDIAWIAADFNGDGKDDLLRCQRSGARFDGDNCYLYEAHTESDHPTMQFGDRDNDGLLDSWETGAVHPGGLDLPSLGCTPGHADVIVEVQPFADVPMNVLNDGLAKVKEYFASIPIHNPDGTDGVAIHFIMREAIPTSEGSAGWESLHERYHPKSHRGITHWMLIYKGGGGQSGGWGDGGQSGCYGMPGVFIHELGHQFGLDHTGQWPLDHNPLYHSIMNYCYNYALDSKGRTVGYSHGDLVGFVLNPRHLTEKIPLPPDKVAFIAGPPYRFHIKPGPDGKSTLVDWNWNGIFGEENIAADINYAYSTTAGTRHHVDLAYSVPAPVTAGAGSAARLLMLFGERPMGAAADVHTVSPGMPGKLAMRLWRGADVDKDAENWSDAVTADGAPITGDPSAAAMDGAAWVAYPTASGVILRKVETGSDSLAFGAAIPVPESAGAQPTLTAFRGGLALILWRSPSQRIGLRLVSGQGAGVSMGDERPLEITSNTPVGAAMGAAGADSAKLWIAGTHDEDKKKGRWQLTRVTVDANGDAKTDSMEWVGGPSGNESSEARISLLWEAAPGFGENGQVYLFSRGALGFSHNQEYVAMRIADKSVNGGWLTRRYYDEWTNSRLSCGVCWFRGDILFASSMFGGNGMDDNNLYVAFHGRGIQDGEMGDFNDIGYIRDYGFNGSLQNVLE